MKIRMMLGVLFLFVFAGVSFALLPGTTITAGGSGNDYYNLGNGDGKTHHTDAYLEVRVLGGCMSYTSPGDRIEGWIQEYITNKTDIVDDTYDGKFARVAATVNERRQIELSRVDGRFSSDIFYGTDRTYRMMLESNANRADAFFGTTYTVLIEFPGHTPHQGPPID